MKWRILSGQALARQMELSRRNLTGKRGEEAGGNFKGDEARDEESEEEILSKHLNPAVLQRLVESFDHNKMSYKCLKEHKICEPEGQKKEEVCFA